MTTKLNAATRLRANRFTGNMVFKSTKHDPLADYKFLDTVEVGVDGSGSKVYTGMCLKSKRPYVFIVGSDGQLLASSDCKSDAEATAKAEYVVKNKMVNYWDSGKGMDSFYNHHNSPSKLQAAKEKTVIYPWVTDILKVSGLPKPRGVYNYIDADVWISETKAKEAIEKLKAAKYKVSGTLGDEVVVKATKEKGITFTWDDPEEEGLVGVFIWEE